MCLLKMKRSLASDSKRKGGKVNELHPRGNTLFILNDVGDGGCKCHYVMFSAYKTSKSLEFGNNKEGVNKSHFLSNQH